jgi:hypothetical protein
MPAPVRKAADAALAFTLLANLRRWQHRKRGSLLLANPLSAALAAEAGTLAFIWPPTRKNALNIGVLIAVGIGIIGYNFQQRRTDLSDKLMQRKRDKAIEQLAGLLNDAKKALTEKEGLDGIVEGLLATQDTVNAWPALLDGIKEHYRVTLKKPEGVQQLIGEVVDWHTKEENIPNGAKLIEVSEQGRSIVADMLKESDFGVRTQANFPEDFPEAVLEQEKKKEKAEKEEAEGKKAEGAEGAEGGGNKGGDEATEGHAEEKEAKEAKEGLKNKAGERGEEEEKEEEQASEDAKEKAEKLTKNAEEVKTWPQGFQDWMMNTLKKEGGVKELAEALVAHHSNKEKAKDGALFPGIADELKQEIIQVLVGGDFGDRCKSKFSCFAAAGTSKGPNTEKCFEVLHCDVEDAPITVLGIAKDNASYAQGVLLLRSTASEEIVEVVTRTRYARKHALALEADAKGKHTMPDGKEVAADELLKYTTGELLDNFLDLLKKVETHFGDDLIDDRAAKVDAAALRKEIGNDKRSYWYRLIHLATPLVPKWGLATLMEVVATGILDPMFRITLTQVADDAMQGASSPLSLHS